MRLAVPKTKHEGGNVTGWWSRSVGVCVSVWWLSEVCVSVVRVSAVLRPVCLPLRVRPRVCPVPELRFVRVSIHVHVVITNLTILLPR